MRGNSRNLLSGLGVGCAAVMMLAGCGSTTPSANGSVTPSTSMSPSPSSSPSSSASPTQPAQSVTPTPTPAATGAVDLPVTAALRRELVAAGAKAKGLVAADFTGLQPGHTYYAYDRTTRTYWAGAALVPSSSSMNAQVSVQDDGGYTLFHHTSGGAWIAGDSALAGPNGPTGARPCTVKPPADVLTIWGWPANSCHPSGV